MEIITKGTVHDISGDYPLCIDYDRGMVQFFFTANDGKYVVATILKQDLVMAVIGMSYDEKEETKN